jgi:hypothetical protein
VGKDVTETETQQKEQEEPPELGIQGEESAHEGYTMTEFRTRGHGKQRKVFPLSKPYGESRTKAEKVVTVLRRQGRRARLVETNRRLKLYAPYRSVLETKTGRIRLIPHVPGPKEEEKRASLTFGEIRKADISVLLRSLKGHDIIVIPQAGGRYEVKAFSDEGEKGQEFKTWKESVEKGIEESRGKRLNRSHSVSRFQLHTTNNEERSYAESVKRMLEENSTFRGLDESRRRIVLGYVNSGLNEYFNTLEDEEGEIGKGVEWDYMDAREFPATDIVKESLKSGKANHKATQIGELIQEWMNTEGGRPRF